MIDKRGSAPYNQINIIDSLKLSENGVKIMNAMQTIFFNNLNMSVAGSFELVLLVVPVLVVLVGLVVVVVNSKIQNGCERMNPMLAA